MTIDEIVGKLNAIAWGPWMLLLLAALLGLSGMVIKLTKEHFSKENV